MDMVTLKLGGIIVHVYPADAQDYLNAGYAKVDDSKKKDPASKKELKEEAPGAEVEVADG